MKKFPFYRQIDQKDCGPTCLRMVAKFYGKVFSREFLREKAHITREGVSLGGIAEAAEAIGMNTLGIRVDIKTLLKEAPLPCIVPWRQRHFVVVYKIKRNRIYVADPGFGLLDYSIEEFKEAWLSDGLDATGFLLLLEPTPNFFKVHDVDEEGKKGFGFLLPYFRPYKRILFQLGIGLLVASVIQLAFPFLMQSIVDYGINYQNISFIYLILIAQLTLFFSQTAIRVIRDWLILHMTSRLNIRMISDFLLKMLKLPLNFFETRNTGEHLQRIQDHQRIQDFLSSSTLNVIFSFFTLLIFGSILAYYNTFIFTIFLLGAIVYIIWSLLFLKRRAELDYKRFDQIADSQTNVVQIINGIREIKINNSQRKKRWHWENIQVQLFKTSVQSLALAQSQNIGGLFINELKNIIITFIAAKSVIEGSMTLGMMLSVQYIIGQLNLPLTSFITFLQSGQDAKISLERLSQVHNKKDEDDIRDNKVANLPSDKTIAIKNLSFQYGGASSPWVLKNLNFIIPEGKTTAIVGASGSGKTTLLKLLLKFYEPTEGEFAIGNTRLNNIHADFWRSRCGSVMQDGYMFNDTIAGNITESEQNEMIDKERLLNAAQIANIERFIERLPNGYNTELGSSGIRLSGGQSQRIYIARAVYKNPAYLFFDEATSALDAQNEKVIMENLNTFLEGKTAVVVAHRLSTVRDADNIIVLDQGEVVEEGTHEELTALKGIYYTLVKNQLELGG